MMDEALRNALWFSATFGNAAAWLGLWLNVYLLMERAKVQVVIAKHETRIAKLEALIEVQQVRAVFDELESRMRGYRAQRDEWRERYLKLENEHAGNGNGPATTTG